MMEILTGAATVLYFSTALLLVVYGLNCYVMIFLFRRAAGAAECKRNAVIARFNGRKDHTNLPPVTTQIAIYNEFNVAERAIRAACAMRYPEGLHEIQVLDDSTDETAGLVDGVVAELSAAGHDIRILRRAVRTGFKAGALSEGLAHAKGELLAVFDADFVPPPEYLMAVVPFFLADAKTGLVQARWGHLNRRHSLLTRAQSIGIDGHFMVEQAARNFNGLYMNFNGTAGVWRKPAIIDGGGWQWDTLTEDMDLSYRVQLAGWETVFLPDLVVPAELPEDIGAFKTQQFRWAKGSIQTAKKVLPRIMAAPVGGFKKLQAFFHVTHYMVHPLMLCLALMALPALMTVRYHLGTVLFGVLALLLIISMMAPSSLYLVSQRWAHRDWGQRILFMPFLVIIGVGIALSNTRAVLEALLGAESDFIRTPKRGDVEQKRYRLKFPWTALLEVLLGLYCALSFGCYLDKGKFLIGPFLAIYTAGFLFIGLLSLAHFLGIGHR